MTVPKISTTPHQAGSKQLDDKTDIPYQTLSKSLLFANLDQHEYWHSVAPMLGRILAQGKYTVHYQYEYLLLLANFIIPMLGPFQAGRAVYKCLLGGIGSIELSQNFQASGTTARMAFEPTGFIASTGIDPFNRTTTNLALVRLKAGQVGRNVDMQLHQMLVNELTLTDEEVQRMTPNEIQATPMKTQILLALDFGTNGDITVKEYFYPDVKAAVTGRSVASLIFAAINKIDVHSTYASQCAIIQAHMQHQPETDIYFLSCDLVRPADTRLKLYLMEREVTFSKAEEHWTMGGRLQDEETLVGLEMIRQLWVAFGIVEGKRAPLSRPTQPGDSSTHVSFIVNYELSPGASAPRSKFYFPLTGISDEKIGHVMTAFFERHGMHDRAAPYMENLKAYYPCEDLAAVTDHQAWLSFSYTKKKGPYCSMYYH